MQTAGKINETFFKTVILPDSGHRRSEVSTGPGFGVDVAVVDLTDELAMLLTSDPLSLIPSLGLQESAWLSVHLMANDMATTGFAPMYLQTVLNLPMYLTDADFKTYWRYIDQYCKEIGVAITGGHTGSIEGQNSTISGGGTMISIAPKKEVLTSKQARAGDLIVMTRQCAMSSTAILAKSFPETVRQKAGNEIAQQAAALFYQTSVLPEALAVNALNKEKSRVHAMHDVTEGGVLGAVVEMAAAAGLGVEVLNDQINVSVVEKAVCSVFDLDPRFCIGSGSMILSVNPDEAETVLNTLRQMEIPACVIGEFTSDASKRTILENDAAYPVPYFETDPYWAAFFGALKRGWK